MASESKTITITGENLVGRVSLTFAFVPPGADTFNTVWPVAWQVFTINNKEYKGWQWDGDLTAYRIVHDPDTGKIHGEEYLPLSTGESSILQKDSTTMPPKYSFTTPVTVESNHAIVENKTGGFIDVGAGFVTTGAGDRLDLNPVLVWRRIADKQLVNVNYAPVLKLWAVHEYEQSQLLDCSIEEIEPLWEGDLTLFGGNILITVKRVKGQLVAEGPTPIIKDKTALTQIPATPTRTATHTSGMTYTVDLAFPTPILVIEGLKAITSGLSGLGYRSKSICQAFNTDARLEVQVPYGVSCGEADRNVLAAVNASRTVFGQASVTKRSGAILLSSEDGYEKWLEIDPACSQWSSLTLETTAPAPSQNAAVARRDKVNALPESEETFGRRPQVNEPGYPAVLPTKGIVVALSKERYINGKGDSGTTFQAVGAPSRRVRRAATSRCTSAVVVQ